MPLTREEGVARMKALAGRQPLRQPAEALEMLDAKAKLDDAERFTRTLLMDVICERCPEAEAAFAAWADSDDNGAGSAVAAIVAAVKGAGA
jgi:hypothetical protein